MIKIKSSNKPIVSESINHDAQKEEKEAKEILDNYFGDNDVGVYV